MKLSRTAYYAVSVMVFMAKQKDKVVVGHEAAKALDLPEGFLLRILVALSRARLLTSIKGPNGGYRLQKPAKDTTLLEIIEAAEGPLTNVMPFTEGVKDKDANRLDKRLADVFDTSNKTIRNQYGKVRLSELAA